jgi:Ion channel
MMFEPAHRPLLSRRRFAARIAIFLSVAVCIDGVALAVGTIGFHLLEDLDWLDASLDSALVITGNGPIHPPHTPSGKLFSIFYALLGVVLYAAVIGVLLTPVFHRMLHAFHSRREEPQES